VRAAHRPAWWVHLVYRVGRRGYFLLLLALVDAVLGYRMIRPESPGQAEQNHFMGSVIDSLDHCMALWFWACLWWATGLVCLFNVLRKQDYSGFGAACAMKVVWVAGNIAAGIDGMPGWQLRAVVWAFIASTVLVVARWPEPHNSFPEVLADFENTADGSRSRRAGDDDGGGR
jgi:hypothetical protein